MRPHIMSLTAAQKVRRSLRKTLRRRAAVAEPDRAGRGDTA
ncbi:MAG: hypothetical protein ACHQ7H_00540 [Candidatus Rokuibacteriota bacterium]|jgi:hypothetical protein